MTFGSSVRDWPMVMKSLRNEMIGVSLCFICGCFVACVVSPWIHEGHDETMAEFTEMSSRGSVLGLISGAAIAIPSGCGVALGVTGEHINPLVGVAISAALLPPIVNSGLALTLGLTAMLREYTSDVVQKHVKVGLLSLSLFLLNWVLIYIFALAMFKVKK